MTSNDHRGINFYEGRECPQCGAPLTVQEVHATTTIALPDGGLLNSSTYECAGPEKHHWGTRIDLGPAALGETRLALIPKKQQKHQ